MKTARHTPAPWTIDPPTAQGDYPICEGPDGFLIATVWHDDSRREQADAKLISAAPELLAACKALLSYSDPAKAREIEARARAAIAKAEGA